MNQTPHRVAASTPAHSTGTDAAGSARRRLRRPPINITPLERAERVALGLLAVVAGAALLTSAGSLVAVVLEVLLVAAGLDLAVTGALGHCPLYRRLGYLPPSLRRTR